MKKGLLALTFVTFFAQAKINLDIEADPLPLVKLNILVPAARLLKNSEENLGLKILEQCFEAGTTSLAKQKFQDALAKYGANLEISPNYQYAEITATFPLDQGKIPVELMDLITADWAQPRINSETFERARKLLKANHMALLDNEQSLLSIGMQKIIAQKLFDLHPLSIETFEKTNLSMVQELHRNYYNPSDIWMGVVAPASAQDDIKTLAQKIFPNAGGIVTGMLKQELKSGFRPQEKGSFAPTFLLVDKKDLAQIHYAFLRINQDKKTAKTELIDNFTNYVLSGASLDSVFVRRIRAEKGLAYHVGGFFDDYYDYPVISLFANPQRSRQAEAFEVLAQVMNELFQGGKLISTIDDKIWAGRLVSYRNSERQTGATPEGRLARRKSVVTGDLSYGLYALAIDKWNVSKKDSVKRVENFAKNSSLLIGSIGDSAEMEPLVKKSFPGANILNVSYKDVISNSWIKNSSAETK